jgi:hypothetical protein
MPDTVETRLETLELQVRDILDKLRTKESRTVGGKDWRKSLGMFDNQPSMKEIDEAGRLIRQQDRQQVVNDHT